MRRIRWREKDEIRQHTGDGARPLTAYPAAVASLFGVHGDNAHTVVRDFGPQDRDSW